MQLEIHKIDLTKILAIGQISILNIEVQKPASIDQIPLLQKVLKHSASYI